MKNYPEDERYIDRAAAVAVAIRQIFLQTRDPAKRQRRIEQYLRDEFADFERQAEADRGGDHA